MIDKVRLLFKRRIGNDLNSYIIRMWQALQKGWIPPDVISEERYKQLKRNSEVFIDNDEAPVRGFAGIACSFGGKWYGHYARGKTNKGVDRNYCLESRNNVLKQVKEIGSVEFYGGDYTSVPLPEKSLIYCDPPYSNTTKYQLSFDSKRFWDWCNQLVQNGHKVYVSEYNAPEDWKCIWQKEVSSSIRRNGRVHSLEKLFTK